MRPRFRIRTAGCLIAAAASALLSACGSSAAPDPTASQQAKAPPKAKPHVVAIGDSSTADMSSAVSLTRLTPTVQLKFEVTSHPRPGQPLQVDFALIPVDSSVATLSARFAGEEGLALVSGAELAPVDKPALGVPIRHSVTVMPGADGIYELIASVTAVSDTDSKTNQFLVPVISGVGISPSAGGTASGVDSSATAVKPR